MYAHVSCWLQLRGHPNTGPPFRWSQLGSWLASLSPVSISRNRRGGHGGEQVGGQQAPTAARVGVGTQAGGEGEGVPGRAESAQAAEARAAAASRRGLAAGAGGWGTAGGAGGSGAPFLTQEELRQLRLRRFELRQMTAGS